MMYGTRNERMSLHHPLTKKVYQYDFDGNLIAEYSCGREASIKTGICRSGIKSAANGNRKSAGGFR